MTRRHLPISASLAGSAVALIVTTAVPAAGVPSGPHGLENVIVLTGDGMGYNMVAEASLHENGVSYKQAATDLAIGRVTEVVGTASQVHESFPVQADMQIFPADGSDDQQRAWTDFDYVKSGATDFVGAGTAMATGAKTYNGEIGVDAESNEVENLYAAIYSRLTTGPGWTPERQQALEWALEQIDHVLQRQQEDDRAAATRATPWAPAMAGPGVIGAIGVALLVIALVWSR